MTCAVIVFFLGTLPITPAAGVSCDRPFYAYNPDTGSCERCDFCCVVGNSENNTTHTGEKECADLYQGDLPSGCFDRGPSALCPFKSFSDFRAANASTTAAFEKNLATSEPPRMNPPSSDNDTQDTQRILYVVITVTVPCVLVFVLLLIQKKYCKKVSGMITRSFVRDKYPTQETVTGQDPGTIEDGHTENLLPDPRTEMIEMV